ncbi:hypothetical protein [Lyngbya confervoides]|uniref:Uncharacterized protein n=1 Tax=Lyngbya confervoides BDU141951 TaxID=1574623 RepID=A0ABD4T1B9_9CYAN|nr:hypothetical protein [Lyngbya confervoides]MCM1982441.1 hypothetical protein [Lyngbya confervoides BDU141951]
MPWVQAIGLHSLQVLSGIEDSPPSPSAVTHRLALHPRRDFFATAQANPPARVSEGKTGLRSGSSNR